MSYSAVRFVACCVSILTNYEAQAVILKTFSAVNILFVSVVFKITNDETRFIRLPLLTLSLFVSLKACVRHCFWVQAIFGVFNI